MEGLLYAYGKLDDAMEIVRADAEAGVIGYDVEGLKVFDVDLLDEKK